MRVFVGILNLAVNLSNILTLQLITITIYRPYIMAGSIKKISLYYLLDICSNLSGFYPRRILTETKIVVQLKPRFVPRWKTQSISRKYVQKINNSHLDRLWWSDESTFPNVAWRHENSNRRNSVSTRRNHFTTLFVNTVLAQWLICPPDSSQNRNA